MEVEAIQQITQAVVDHKTITSLEFISMYNIIIYGVLKGKMWQPLGKIHKIWEYQKKEDL